MACFLVVLTIGETFWSFGVFFKPLEDEFGWSRALTSSSYTAFLIGYAVSVVVAGRLVDRYSPRPILLVSALLAGFGIAMCSRIEGINMLRVFLFITGLGAGATWSVPSATVQRWFYKRKGAGMALSIVVAGVGVGALIFAPLINFLILNYGWRTAFLVVGILYFILVAVSALVIRKSPASEPTDSEENQNKSSTVSSQGLSTARAVINPSFIGISVTIAITVVAFQFVVVHLVPLATDINISRTSAAAALGLMGGFSIIGRIMPGFISDKMGWQKTLALSLFGMAFSLIWLLLLKTEWMLYAFVFFYGVFWGGRSPAWAGIMGEFYGMRSLGELIGISTAISQFIGAFAPYIAGFIYDTTGSYTVALIIVMLILFGGSILAITIKNPLMAARSH